MDRGCAGITAYAADSGVRSYNMKEIGGYFGLESLVRNLYYPDLIPVNTARYALVYILRAKQIRKIWLPYFLCESVRLACEKEGVEIGMYHIDAQMHPIWSELPAREELGADEYLYIVNYYGQIGAETAAEMQRTHGNMILDNVQAFFQRPVPGMDTVYSCRKFFGVPDGGYAATDARLNPAPEQDVSSGRLAHLLGRFEHDSASMFYAQFKENDHAFLEQDLRMMSVLTENLLGAVDYEAVRSRREANFEILANTLGAQNPLPVHMPDGPYSYPFYCENGMALKKRLAACGIYVPTLWPNVLDMEGTREKDYAENILPLPCDQRYGEAEMNRIIEEIHNG